MQTIEENPPKRQNVRDFLYSTLKAQNPTKITVGQMEDFINGIIDIAISEATKHTATKKSSSRYVGGKRKNLSKS